jgi:hypothetical protein
MKDDKGVWTKASVGTHPADEPITSGLPVNRPRSLPARGGPSRLGAADTLSVEVTRSPAGLTSGDLRSAKRLFDVSVFEQITKSAGWYRIPVRRVQEEVTELPQSPK